MHNKIIHQTRPSSEGTEVRKRPIICHQCQTPHLQKLLIDSRDEFVTSWSELDEGAGLFLLLGSCGSTTAEGQTKPLVSRAAASAQGACVEACVLRSRHQIRVMCMSEVSVVRWFISSPPLPTKLALKTLGGTAGSVTGGRAASRGACSGRFPAGARPARGLALAEGLVLEGGGCCGAGSEGTVGTEARSLSSWSDRGKKVGMNGGTGETSGWMMDKGLTSPCSPVNSCFTSGLKV